MAGVSQISFPQHGKPPCLNTQPRHMPCHQSAVTQALLATVLPFFTPSFQIDSLSVYAAAGTGGLPVTVPGQSLPSQTLHCRAWQTVIHNE